MRVCQDDFIAIARIGLTCEGRKAIILNGARVLRRHDKADEWQMFGIGRHGATVPEALANSNQVCDWIDRLLASEMKAIEGVRTGPDHNGLDILAANLKGRGGYGNPNS